ncbi:hypothetical protein MA16_Dca015618 [Dendrobium catenatum]|uniref:Uncharacterized protein n=1 Tax=Dendrobium catenatum TaxID=906689 RepID=A0A2I0WJB7_9ASPA|nr:hypothetical protein MA16_Dca015618 [Dendrobium catenatum]
MLEEVGDRCEILFYGRLQWVIEVESFMPVLVGNRGQEKGKDLFAAVRLRSDDLHFDFAPTKTCVRLHSDPLDTICWLFDFALIDLKPSLLRHGDDCQKGIIKNIFGRCNKKITISSSSRSVHIEGTSSSQPATQSQPSPRIPAPATVTQSQPSPQFYSPDPHLPSLDLTQTTPFYPYFPPPPHGVYPTYPPYSYPSYVPPPTHPLQHHLSPLQQSRQQRVLNLMEEYTRLRESQDIAGEGSSAGSAEYSDYRTWQQAVGGLQYGKVYGLGYSTFYDG